MAGLALSEPVMICAPLVGYTLEGGIFDQHVSCHAIIGVSS